MARLGIIGYPNAGKTTLFNALTGLSAPTAPHPFSTTEPNVGVARVSDELLDRAADVEGSAKRVYATLDLLDAPALVHPGHGGGLGAHFLARLRESEGLIVVLRAFVDASVPSDESGTDPVEQAENLLLELALADVEVFSRRSERVGREATADASKRREADILDRAATLLAGGVALRAEDWSADERAVFRDLSPLTLKPAVWVVNAGEDETADMVAALRHVVPAGDTAVQLSARIEEEGSRLEPAERVELFEGLGLGEGAPARIVKAAYEALGLLSFYTLGPKEAHAWTVRRGAAAREAAGKIHSDLERGFIRAEVCDIHTVISAGGWDPARAAGKVRVEGKEYEVREGDVIVVRFSV